MAAMQDIAETMFDPLPKMGETCASGNSLTLPGLVMAAVNGTSREAVRGG